MAKLNKLRDRFAARPEPDPRDEDHYPDCPVYDLLASVSGLLGDERLDAMCTCDRAAKIVSAGEKTPVLPEHRCAICLRDRRSCGHFVGHGAL